MGQPITILGSTAIWPTTGDTGYSAGALQTVQLLATAVKPIEGLYNTNTGQVGNISIDDSGNLVLNGIPIGTGSVSSVAIASPADITVAGSPITTSGTITLNLSTTGVSPGSYTIANITVDAKGRITSASNGSPPAAGTVTTVSASGLQGVTTNVTNPTTTPNIEIGLGNITPTSLSTSGNITLTGNPPKIQGPFTGLATRLQFQSTVSNGQTTLEALPNGTGVQSNLNFNNTSDINNTAVMSAGINSTSAFIESTVRGTGTVVPLNLRMNGSTKLSVLTSGDISVTQNLNVTGPITASNISGTNTGDQNITLTGDITGVGVGQPNTGIATTLANTTVVPGTYTRATITVDAKGRITAANSNANSGVWGQITGNITDQTDLNNVFTALGNATLGTGVTTLTDSIGLIALNNTTVRLKAVTQSIFSSLIPAGLAQAVRIFAQQDYALSGIPLAVDGIYVRFIGVDTNGVVVTSANTFKSAINILQYGYMILKRVAGVITFLDGAVGPRNVFTWPDFAGNVASATEFFTPQTNIAITPNPSPGLTVKNSAGVIKGLNINWGTSNVNERAIATANPTSFITINPGNALATTLPAPGTAVQVSQYWNGTAMTNLGGPNVSSVQRFIITIAGVVFLQVGEALYANFAAAIDNISVAPFTPIIPPDSFIEIVRFAARSGATNLSNNSDAVFQSAGGSGGGGGGGGGGGAGTVTSVDINGANGVTSLGGPVTSSGVITVGLGAITPTTVSTGDITSSGNLNFTGVAKIISGDFSNATVLNRQLFQTSTVNGNTFLTTIPNGTSTRSGFLFYNNINPINSASGFAGINNVGGGAGFGSVTFGTGPAIPTTIFANGLNGLAIDILGNTQLGGAGRTPASTTGYAYLTSVSNTPNGTPTSISSFAPITIDTTNNLVYFYSGGAWRNVVSGNTTVLPGSYTYSNITVDAQGRITAASNGTPPGGGTVTSVGIVSTTLNSTGGPISTNGNITVDLPVQTSSGSYINANITVDGFGRVTAASNGSGGVAGSNTQIQYNNSGAFGASSNLTWDGSQVSINGNLNFAGTSRRIIGDMTNGTVASRLAFQTSTVNGATNLEVFPNGTSQTANIVAENSSSPLNSSFMGFSIGATNADVLIGARGSGSILAFRIRTTAFTYFDLSNGNVALGVQSVLPTNSTGGYVSIRNTNGVPTGTPLNPVTGQTPIIVDNTTGHIWIYAGTTWHDPTVIEQNIQTVDYTCVLTDAGKHLLHPSADTTARTFTIPANSSVPYLIGTTLMFVNQNAGGAITIAITTDTMRLAGAGTTGNRTLAANGIATALKITSTEWIINGTGLT